MDTTDARQEETDGFDKQLLNQLASAVLDGHANESQLRELTQLLRANSSARDEYLRLVDLHAVLSTELVANSSTGNPQDPEPIRPAEKSNRRLMTMTAFAALAASLLIAVNWGRKNESNGVSELLGSIAEINEFALIAQGTDVVWQSGAYQVGDRVGAETLKLTSGIVRIEFDSGVEVTLEGPAEFELFDADQTRLKSGLLTATVPAGAEGFTVDTPSAQVIDLGTSFGIDIGSDGFSNVSVFDGEVEVVPIATSQKRLLSEGEALRIGENDEIEEIIFDPKRFERVWPIASGIAGSTESVRFVPPWPKQIRFIQSDDEIFVRREGQSVRLSSILDVNISEPGDYALSDDLTPSTLESDQTIRSYVLHFSPKTKVGRRKSKRVTGSITFAHPVMGIIVSHDELAASSRRFGRRGAGEVNQRRELNLTGDEMGDRISLSEDRKTIKLDLFAPGRSSDLMRVIVRSGGF